MASDNAGQLTRPGLPRQKSVPDSYDILYLCSYPLVYERRNKRVPLDRLNFEEERRLLVSSLQESNRELRLRMGFATSSNFCSLTVLGCRVMHLSMHGVAGFLAFEDETGGTHPITSESLRQMLSAGGGGSRGVELVCVSACHSLRSGQAFVEAGVPHVVAVKIEKAVADTAARRFLHQFYLALAARKSVQAAFDIAVSAVQNAPDISVTEDKFVLLPPNGDHSARLFRDTPAGEFKDETPDLPPHSLPAEPSTFQGRNLPMHEIIRNFKKFNKKCVAIEGARGVGKTAVAIATGRYMLKRGMFTGGVYFVSVKRIAPEMSLAEACALEMRDLNPAMRGVKTNMDLQRALNQDSSKSVLLILDGIDHPNTRSGLQPPESHDVGDFLSMLFQWCSNLHVLLTACMFDLPSIPVRFIKLEPLAPQVAAKLFLSLAPRKVPLHEFGCKNQGSILSCLSKHAVLKTLAGNPQRIHETAAQLRRMNMDELAEHMSGSYPDEVLVAPSPISQQRRSPSATSFGSFSHHGGQNSISGISSPDPSGGGRSPSASVGDVPLGNGNADMLRAWRFMFPDGEETVSLHAFRTALARLFYQRTNLIARGLSDSDLEVICSRFLFNSPTITLQQFASFWAISYLKVEGAIRLLESEWIAEPQILHGFKSRSEAEVILDGCQPGTFLLRFTASAPGCVAVSFVDDGYATQHTLISTTSDSFSIEIEGGQAQWYSSLAELVRMCKPLVYLHPNRHKDDVFASRIDEPS